MALDPGTAAVEGGVGLLKTLLEQKAARERERRETELMALQKQSEAEQNMSNQQQGAFANLMARYGGLV